MKRLFITFEWFEAESGVWLDGHKLDNSVPCPEPEPFLIAGSSVESYSPLKEEQAFFRIFARLSPTKDEIRSFAAKYGLLGVAKDFVVFDMEEIGTALPQAPFPRRGEALARWRSEIFAIRRCVQLWDYLQSKSEKGLARHIRSIDRHSGRLLVYSADPTKPVRSAWLGDQVIDLSSTSSSGSGDTPPWPIDEHYACVVASDSEEPELWHGSKPGNLSVPAKRFIAGTANERLVGLVSPTMLIEARDESLGLGFAPRNLLGAIWLQLCQAIDDNKEFLKCRQCGKLFELSPNENRSDKVFCKDACKSRAYRERKEQAFQLHKQGETFAAIAKTLETEATTVEKWVAALQKKEGGGK